MLPSLRSTASRAFLLSKRSVSTVPTSNADLFKDAMSALNSVVGAPQEAVVTQATHSPTSALLEQPPRGSTSINIPPAEDPLLQYLTSSIQHDGHRQKAARIVSRMLLHLHTFTRAPPLPIVREAVYNASPAVRCITSKRGRKNVVTPVALGEKQRTRYAVQWILNASEKQNGRTMEERLAREMIAAVHGTSDALKKKVEVHKFAMINRGNAQSRI